MKKVLGIPFSFRALMLAISLLLSIVTLGLYSLDFTTDKSIIYSGFVEINPLCLVLIILTLVSIIIAIIFMFFVAFRSEVKPLRITLSAISCVLNFFISILLIILNPLTNTPGFSLVSLILGIIMFLSCITGGFNLFYEITHIETNN